MADVADRRIELADLERAVTAVDPAARVVPRRILRRVIKHDRELTGIGLQVPHRKCYVIDAEKALEIVTKDEMGLKDDDELPSPLILIARLDPDEQATQAPGAILVRYWRLLFHARIHLALARPIAQRTLTRGGVRARIHRIGQTEFDEIRAVLAQENFLFPPHDDFAVYTEFAAVYLELRFFAELLIPRYFPGLRDVAAVDRLLEEDVAAGVLFEATRPDGAPDPVSPRLEEDAEADADEETDAAAEEEEPSAARPRSEVSYRWMMGRADLVAARGNTVRAVILRTWAARLAPYGRVNRTKEAARAELKHLVHRLAAALELDQDQERRWRRALVPLLERAARGVWTAEGRLLYDLQKVCVDHEREVHTVDLVGWARSLGRRPIRRPLPHLREVLMVKHLRSAARRLRKLRLDDADRDRLTRALGAAVERAEERLRVLFRPLIRAVLDQTGMRPRDLAEGVARDKIVEELLDRIVERGYVVMGDLRDAISRNQLKLPDLAGPMEFFRGDRLMRADRALALELEGVYRGGEIYLRGLQRQSSVAFGTRAGRFLTRYIALPFGGAFVILEGLQHLINPLVRVLTGVPFRIHLLNPISFTIVGTLTLALLYVEEFRRSFLATLRLLVRALRTLLIDLPVRALRWPPLRRVLESRFFVLLSRSALEPLALTVPVWLVLWAAGADPQTTVEIVAALFLILSLMFNSRIGRDLQEIATDVVVWTWHRLRLEVLPGLFRLVMETFDRLVEAVDRFLYAVDEWLRFRGGEDRLSLAVKAVLGLVWFCVAYVVRIYVNLLIEPQVNPIKHFPVVTVSHKIILPMSFTLTRLMEAPLTPLVGRWVAGTIAWVTMFLLPGVFGFLVWELKENWRLYAANRPEALQPVLIGHHGETMSRLLRPGFHSGTLPKLYAKLRKAERKGPAPRRRSSVRKYREALHHVEWEIRCFVEREFLAPLRESRSMAGAPLAVGQIATGSNRVLVELSCTDLTETSLWVAFEEQSGWLIAGIAQPGWLGSLADDQRLALTTAVAGLYKMAGVDLVREQIRACFEPDVPWYDLSSEGLVVWPGGDCGAEAVYDLDDRPALRPRTTGGLPAAALPVLDADRLLFGMVKVTWRRWVEAWQRDQEGQGHPEPFVAGVRLLPDPDAPPSQVLGTRPASGSHD